MLLKMTTGNSVQSEVISCPEVEGFSSKERLCETTLVVFQVFNVHLLHNLMKLIDPFCQILRYLLYEIEMYEVCLLNKFTFD